MHFSLASYNSPLRSRIFPIQKADTAFWGKMFPLIFRTFFHNLFLCCEYFSTYLFQQVFWKIKLKPRIKRIRVETSRKRLNCNLWLLNNPWATPSGLSLNPIIYRVYHCTKSLSGMKNLSMKFAKKIPSGIDKFS